MKPLKAHMRHQWVKHLRDEIEKANLSEGKFTLRPPSRFELVEWVNEAWENIPRKTIIKGFTKCKIISTMPTSVEVPESTVEPAERFVDDGAAETNLVLETLLQYDESNLDVIAMREDEDEINLHCDE
ncbi:Aste57867_4175 [Aphanomyces stellatus]|uniref:Aste57867_4175 protein n=1 Tax=Aphanomyces stellatus TaxID=120398 RepID=A0A485KB23_9STRA|nr:hypothetical protein As57867_004164 [Aphanomyces stellatus]VFT81299.1 Aste57867_4175 [Aphanomyces stellatus]